MDKGQIQLKIFKRNTAVDPFGSNAPASLVYRKAERLVTATYMITNYVPKDESLRDRVRDMSGKLLSDTIKLRNGFTSLGEGVLANITAQVRLLLSLLDTLYASGFVSEMNLRIIKDAYIDFVNNLVAMSTAKSSDGVELSKDYFTQESLNEEEVKGPTIAKGKPIPTSQDISTKTKLSNISSKSSKKVSKMPKGEKRTVSNNRFSNILEFITKRGSASTGDLAQFITDCSSKTLQRDLRKLVNNGKLKKEGSKRWTRYSLV